MKILKTTFIAGVLACSGFVAAVSSANHHEADEAQNEKFQLDAITCWEVITLPEEDTASALLLLYGYASGLTATSEHSGESIKATLTSVGEICEENPEMPALKAFQKQSK